jgi:hypothetical protein
VVYDGPHNFLKKELESELGLGVRSWDASVKAINSKAKATTGVAFANRIQLKKLKCRANFTLF